MTPAYNNNVSFYIAETVSDNANTYNLDTDKQRNDNIASKNIRSIYTINALILVSGRVIPIKAKPADINNVKIPLNGEHVVVFYAYRSDSNTDKHIGEWYYLNAISLNSDTNLNSIPGITSQDRVDTKPGNGFKSKPTSILQLYPGDVVSQGRWGNSIRFGSTIDISATKTEKRPVWEGDEFGAPITVIANERDVVSTNEFASEQLNTGASIYLTSTQNIPTLQLGSETQKNSLKCFLPTESQYSQSQLIGIADRIILKAKTDVAVLDAEKGIVLNTTGEVKIGNDTADQSMVHGDVLLTTLQAILNQLRTPIQCGTSTGTFLSTVAIDQAQRNLRELLSSKYFIKKETY